MPAISWQQGTAAALARRLLVVGMACVVVWQLARSTAPEAEKVREVLTRLSGRQMKQGQSHSYAALLAGLWVFLAMVDVLEHYDIQEIKRGVDRIFPRPTGQPIQSQPHDEALV